MKTIKLINKGSSQLLKLPKEFEFHSKEVQILRRGEEVIIREQPENLKRAFELLAGLPIDNIR